MNGVNPAANDRHDQQYEDLLGPAAFGTLTAAEAGQVEDFLAMSASARAELAELRIIAGGLALLAEPARPSIDLRNRIEHVVMADMAWMHPTPIGGVARANGESDSGIVPLSTVPAAGAKRPTPLWRPYVWAAAAALALAVLSGIALDRLVLNDADSATERETIAYDLTLAAPIPDLSAELTYDADDQLFILETENMPPAPENSVYQVWLIQDGVPTPVGVMNQSTFAVPAARDAYQAFAITVEPGPLGSEGPTTDPFFVAPLINEGASQS